MADLYYIEEGYYDAGYFVYTADAAAAVSSSASVTVSANLTADGQGSLSSSATVTATISHIHGADLTALSDAALTVAFERIRYADSSLTSTSSQSADVVKTADAASSLSSSASLSSTVGKIIEQDDDLTLTWNDLPAWDGIPSDQWVSIGVWLRAPFTISALLEEVVGQAVYGEGTWSSAFTQTASAELTKSTPAAFSAEFNQSSSALRTRDTAAAISSELSQSADAQRTRDVSAAVSVSASQTVSTSSVKEFDAAISSQATQSAAAYRIIEGTVAITGAFAPVVTASALKNHTAVIESFFGFTANVVANRSANITLETINNLSSQGDRIRTTSSSITSTATFTAQATGLEFAEAALSSTFTQTSSALKIKRAEAALTATSSLSATAIDLAERPRQFTEVGSPQFSTSVKKFGTHSYYNTNSTSYVTIPDSGSWNSNTWRTFDAWVYFSTDPSQIGGYFQTLFRQYASGTSYQQLIITAASSGVNKVYRFAIQAASGASTVDLRFEDTTNGIMGWDSWTHIRVLNDGSAYHLWINGQKKTLTSSGSTTYISNLNVAAAVELNKNSLPSQYSVPIYMDELVITSSTITGSGTSSFTPPTQAWIPNNDLSQSDILVLSHFDGAFEDDMMIIEIGQAAITSTASLTATATKTQSAFVATTLSSAFSQSAQATKTTGTSSADLSSQFTLVAQAESSVNALIASAGTLTATARVIARGSATLGNTVQLSAILNTTGGSATAFLASTATLSAQVFKADKDPAPIALDNYRLYHLDDGPSPIDGQFLRATYFQERGKFGYDAILNPTGGVTLGYVPGTYPASGDNWSIDFWHRGRTNNTGSTDWKAIATIYGNRWLEYDGNANRYRIRGLIATGSSGGFNSGAPGAGYYARLAFNWTHIAIQRKDDVFTFFVNGVSAGSLSDTITTTSEVSFGTNTNGALSWTTITGAFDEIRLNTLDTYYTGNFTPATAAYATEAQDYYTVKNGYGDIEAIATVAATPVKLVVTSAAITAAFTQTSNAVKTVRTAKLLSAEFTLTSNAGKRVAGDTALAAAVTASADALVTRLVPAALSAAVTQTALAQRFRDPTLSTITSTASAEIVTGFLKQGAATLAGQGGFTIDAVAQLAGVALLESQFEITLTPSVTRLVPAALSAQSTVSATTGFLKSGDSALASEFTQAVTSFIKVPVQFAAALTANFTQTADYIRYRDSAATVTAASSVTAAVNANPDAIINLFVTATTLQSADRLRDPTLTNFSSSFAQAQTIDVFRSTPAVLSAETTVTATITRIKPLASAVTANASVFFLGGKLNEINLVSTGFATLTASVTKSTDITSTITSASALTADNIRVRYSSSTLTTTATMSVAAVKTTDITKNLAVTATVTVAAQRLRDPTATNLGSEFTVIANAKKDTDIESLMQVTATVTADVSVNKAIQAVGYWSSTATMTTVNQRVVYRSPALAVAATTSTQPVKTARTGSALVAQTTESATAVKYTGIILNITAQGFTLTVGDVINLDPRLTLRVPPETRTIKVASETRVIQVI